MKKKRTIAVTVLAGALAFGGSAAWGGTTYVDYSTTVASNAGYGYSSYQVKTNSNTSANLRSTNVGGSYVLSTRTNSPFGTGTWTGYVVDDNTNHSLQNSHASGSNVRLQLRNRPQTFVQVQADGSWRSN